jgi:hypothetical protein
MHSIIADTPGRPRSTRDRLFVVQHGLSDYHSHYYGETKGWQAACRARGIEPRFYINQHASEEIVREFAARPVFPFASDAIVEPDATCRKVSDFLTLGHYFAQGARALESDGLDGSDLVLVPFAGERDIFGIALWLHHLDPAARPTIALIFHGPDLSWQVEPGRGKVRGEFGYHRYAMKRLKEVLPAEKILAFATDRRLGTLLAAILNHPCGEIPPGVHYPDLEAGPTFNHAHIRIMGELRPERGSKLITRIIQEFGAQRPGRTVSLQATTRAVALEIFRTLNQGKCQADVEVLHGDRNGHLRHGNFLRRLVASDIMLLPYSLNRYAMRSSYVFAEAVGFGLVTVVPDRTWMADKLAAGHGSGIVFSDFTVEAITRALVAASDAYPELKEKAVAGAAAWRGSHSIANTLDTLLRTRAEVSAAPAKA